MSASSATVPGGSAGAADMDLAEQKDQAWPLFANFPCLEVVHTGRDVTLVVGCMDGIEGVELPVAAVAGTLLPCRNSLPHQGSSEHVKA